MIRRTPRSTRTDTLFPYTTLFRFIAHDIVIGLDRIRPVKFVEDVLAPDTHPPFAVRSLDTDVRVDERVAVNLECGLVLRADIDRSDGRSEEHTSELQSLMRNSYAVFCSKKKKTNNKNKHGKN